MITVEWDGFKGVWFVIAFGERHEFEEWDDAQEYKTEVENWWMDS